VGGEVNIFKVNLTGFANFAGCETVCGDGIVASDFEECDDGLPSMSGDGCSSDCQLEEGWNCSSPGTPCTSECGDEEIAFPRETCDDGNFDNNDGCSSTCQLEVGWYLCGDELSTKCGDGLVVGDEECDQGALDQPGCTNCRLDKGYLCTGMDIDTCQTVYAKCGDGYVIPDVEECDNKDNTDGCTDTCTVKEGWDCSFGICSPICGDNMVVGSEMCDEGDNNGEESSGCDSNCRVLEGFDPVACLVPGNCVNICSDSRVVYGETCDDGNLINGDGCDSNCQIEDGWECEVEDFCIRVRPICGDGRVLGSETCDGGLITVFSGCDTTTCTALYGWVCDPTNSTTPCTPFCGDGIVVGGETCDALPGVAGCTNCQVDEGYTCRTISNGYSECSPVCGDNKVIEPYEMCDLPLRPCPDDLVLDPDCPYVPACGNNCQPNPGWECSGNTCYPVCDDAFWLDIEVCDNTEGCSNCAEEPGWKCENHECSTKCGDHIVLGAEMCDNVTGCAADCTPLGGWTCDAASNHCTNICGDSQVVGLEECDDGNTKSGDGCSYPACTVEMGYYCRASKGATSCFVSCGDGYLFPGTEECDDGNNNSGDGCFGCKIEQGWTCQGTTCQRCTPVQYCSALTTCTTNQGDSVCPSCNTGYSLKKGVGTSDTCFPTCGDGIRLPNVEQCDDGNTISSDGCSSGCILEMGFACAVPGQACACSYTEWSAWNSECNSCNTSYTLRTRSRRHNISATVAPYAICSITSNLLEYQQCSYPCPIDVVASTSVIQQIYGAFLNPWFQDRFNIPFYAFVERETSGYSLTAYLALKDSADLLAKILKDHVMLEKLIESKVVSVSSVVIASDSSSTPVSLRFLLNYDTTDDASTLELTQNVINVIAGAEHSSSSRFQMLQANPPIPGDIKKKRASTITTSTPIGVFAVDDNQTVCGFNHTDLQQLKDAILTELFIALDSDRLSMSLDENCSVVVSVAPPHDDAVPIGAIIGPAVGGSLALLVLLLALIFLLRRKSTNEDILKQLPKPVAWQFRHFFTDSSKWDALSPKGEVLGNGKSSIYSSLLLSS